MMQERKLCIKSTRPAEALGLRVEIPKNDDLQNVNVRTPIRRSYSSASLPDCYDCSGHQLDCKNNSLVSFPRHSPREISPTQVQGLSPSSTISEANDDGYADGEAVDSFDQIMTTPLANATIGGKSFLFRGCLKNPMDAEEGSPSPLLVVKQDHQNKKFIGASADTLRDSSDFSHVGLSLSSPNPLEPSEKNEATFDNKERL